MDFNQERKQTAPPLKIDVILAALPDTDADDLRQALTDRKKNSHAHIARTVTDQSDFSVGVTAVALWRERNL